MIYSFKVRSSILEFDSEKGQILNYIVGGNKIFHSFSDFKYGEWSNSHITMFPIVGKESLRGKDFNLGSHGIIRYIIENSKFKLNILDSGVEIIIDYDPEIDIKYKGEKLFWNHSFIYKEKIFLDELGDLEFKISIENNSNTNFDFNIGTHPAFKSIGKIENNKFKITYLSGKVEVFSLNKILDSQGNFKTFENIKKITFISDEISYDLIGNGYNEAQIWSPVDSMFCIENMYKNEKTQKKDNLVNILVGGIKEYITKLKINNYE